MKISFIATVFNEQDSIGVLLESITAQSRVPDEVIIVDGGSTDKTLSVISKFTNAFTSEESKSMLRHRPRWEIITKKGNRAVGRNEAIRKATGDIIVVSDAGCVLDKDWVKNIVEPFSRNVHLGGAMAPQAQPVTIRGGGDSDVGVVAGYYAAKTSSAFQKCLVPYVLVMPDKVDPNNFLPATRSMAFRKSIWDIVGGFPEEYSHNEDYVFARRLRAADAKIVFAEDAVVSWMPRKSLKESFVMFYRFAFGDAEAGIVRPKVLFLFTRYGIGALLLVSYFVSHSSYILNTIYVILALYIVWSIVKNFKYVPEWQAFFLLPILQVVSDMAVITGTISGFISRFLGGGYSKNTLRGVSWIGGLRVTTRVVSFLKIAILARILTPAQFGAYGIAAIVLSFLEILTETGVNVLLIQEKGNIDKYINSAWVISIGRGIIVAAAIFLSAPFIAEFFHSSEALFLLQLASIVPLLRGFINPSVVKFQKELQFNKEFLYRFLVFITDASFAVLFAVITQNPTSIVFGLIVGVFLEVILSFMLVSPRPRLEWDTSYLKKIVHRGKWVTMSGVFNFLFYNADNIVVGRLLGSGPLGLYQAGYSLSILPISEVTDVVSRVTFPVYTKIAGDKVRLKSAFIKTLFVITFCTLPFGILLFFFPETIVKLVLGEQWLGIVPALRILAIFGVLRAISGFASTLFLSVEKQEYVTMVTLASIVGLAISIIPLVSQFGIVGAGIAALIGAITAIPFYTFFIYRIFRFSL